MASSKSSNIKTAEDELEYDEYYYQQLLLSLPKSEYLAVETCLYQGFWLPTYIFEGTIAFQNHFQAYDTDIILASLPKTGTTWLKSLLFAISNRHTIMADDYYLCHQHPFHTKNPHQLILQFEFNIYKKINGDQPDLTHMSSSPRMFGTHIPYPSLPESIKNSKCRIVYVCRNPFDTFISFWLFALKFDSNKGLEPNMGMMEEYVDKFCQGDNPFGPYEDHLLGFFKESRKNPEKVLFLEYEGLKNDPKSHLKKLADFVGCSFSKEEEKGGVIDEILQLCSLESMKEMEVNKTGKFSSQVGNHAYFRKGEVGDWNNYLTPSMANRIQRHMLQKLSKDGFSFQYSSYLTE